MKVLCEIYNRIEERKGYGEEGWSEFSIGLNEVENKLLDLVAQQTDDKTAAKELFQSGKSLPAFRKKKLSLRKSLLNEILKYQPNHKNSPDIRVAYYEALKLSHQFAILYSWSAYFSYKEVALQLYKKAVFYDFTDKVIEASWALMEYYKIAEPNTKLRKYYFEKCKEYMAIREKEVLVQWYASEVLAHFNNKRRISSEAYLSAEKYENELSNLNLNFTSYKFFFSFYQIKIDKYLSVGNFVSALPVAKEAYAYFSGLRYEHVAHQTAFLRKIADIQTHLGLFADSLCNLEKCTNIQVIGNRNWFILQESIQRIQLALGHYKDAFDIYKSTISNKNFTLISPEIQEQIYLQGAYIGYLSLLGKITQANAMSRKSINILITKCDRFESDPAGMRIPLTILRLLFDVYDREYDAMERKINSLRAYCDKYLVVKNKNFRSNCFIKMLLTIPMNHFNPVTVKRKAAKYLERMSQKDQDLASPMLVEIIPYEHLWETVLENLQAPKRKRASKFSADEWSVDRA